MKRIMLILVIFLTVFASKNALAGVENQYIGLGLNYGWMLTDDVGGYDVDFDESFGLNLHAGYKFNDVIALQFDFDWFYNFELTSIGNRNTSGDTTVLSYMIGPKIMLPTDSDFIPYIIGGAGFMIVRFDTNDRYGFEDDNDTAFGVNFGVGFDYQYDDNWSVGLLGRYYYSDMNFSGYNVDVEIMAISFRSSYHF